MTNNRAMRYTYLTNCTETPLSEVEDLEDMIEDAREIKYITFMKYVWYLELKRIFPQYCHRKDQGLTLKNDWHVRYFRSWYKGQRCVYIVHSAIEYIFTDRTITIHSIR